MNRAFLLSGIILLAASTYADASSSEYTVPKSVYVELCRSKTITGPQCQALLTSAVPKLPANSAPNPASTAAAGAAAPPPKPAPGCVPNKFFFRSDSLDNFNYLLALSGSAGQSPNASAKGLGISYTDNRQAGTENATIDGRLSYLAYCYNVAFGSGLSNEPFVSHLAFAPFVGSNGTWNEPVTTTTTSATVSKATGSGTTTTASSNGITTTTIIKNKNGTVTTVTKKYSLSSLRVGADFQAAVSLWPPPPTDEIFSPRSLLPTNVYFYASPYYQTDYQGFAKISGADIQAEPVYPQFFVNSGVYNPTFGYMTQFSAGAELTQVNEPGLTLLAKGAHAWIGETARPNLTLFPGGVTLGSVDQEWLDNWIRGRISLIGTQEYYWDAATKRNAAYYEAILQYKLGACTLDIKNPNNACNISGSSAISLQYDFGRDKDTNVKVNQVLVKLSYSY
jgi:hypothetical protein